LDTLELSQEGIDILCGKAASVVRKRFSKSLGIARDLLLELLF
jgi:hypothetical protein